MPGYCFSNALVRFSTSFICGLATIATRIVTDPFEPDPPPPPPPPPAPEQAAAAIAMHTPAAAYAAKRRSCLLLGLTCPRLLIFPEFLPWRRAAGVLGAAARQCAN